MVVFFDLDETLLDHGGAERQAALDFHEHYKTKMVLSPEDFVFLWHSLAEKHFERYQNGQTTFQGQRRGRLREVFGDRYGALTDAQADSIFETYLRFYEKHWTTFSDVLPCLDALRGILLGIITNGAPDQQNKKLVKTGIQGRFSQVICSEDVGVSKPDPKIFLIAAKKMGVEPSDCFYIGDRAQNDAAAASMAGMKGIWLNRTGESKATEGIATIRSLSELPALIGAA